MKNSSSESEKERSRRLLDEPASLEGEDEHKLEYIKSMIALVREDIRHVMLFISFAIGMTVVFLSETGVKHLQPLSVFWKSLTCSGILVEAVASVLLFAYIRGLHVAQMKMTRCLVALDVVRTRELWAGPAGVWHEHKIKYKTGLLLLVLGTATLLLVVLYIVWSGGEVGAEP